ncbi:MAG: MotA/TolQ/ExbB proton channel family protein [Desulfuromonadaceae bacterium]|nr:MotA/TolQ/ExbB proton channel family protein [Desulfuromonadaceae bacterium]
MMEIFDKGGPLLYVIAFCSVLALGIFLERLWVFARLRGQFQALAAEIGSLVEKGKRDEAEAACLRSRNPLATIFLAALKSYGKPRDQIKQEVEEAGSRQTVYVNRYLGLMSTIATLSPLLGLLGTVLGMIKAFNVIAVQGVGTPATLGGGISEALLTTAAGLSVAIPVILLHRYLSSRASLIILEMEEHSIHLVNQLSR